MPASSSTHRAARARPSASTRTPAVLRTALCLAVAALPFGRFGLHAQASAAEEPLFAELPEACSYLTQSVATQILRADADPGPANEHLPTLSSQCIYGGEGVRGREVGLVFRMMPWELFDVTLDPIQLNFNAQFTVGGVPPSDTWSDLGKIAFVFEDGDRTTLVVVTGFRGPVNFVGQETEFVATYYLEDPDRAHGERLSVLQAQAEGHMAEWKAQA